MALSASEHHPTPLMRQAGRQGSGFGRGDAWLILIVLAAVSGAMIWMQARPTRAWLIDFGIGDAVAYLRIAWNVMRGVGVTYDGVQATNGFHPLWLLLHLPLMVQAQAPWDRLEAARALWCVVALLAAWAWGWLLMRATGSLLAGCATALLMALSGWSLFTLYQGLETPLVLLLTALAFLEVRKIAPAAVTPQRWQTGARVGLVLGLAMLARLDAVFVLIPLALLALLRLNGRGRIALIVAGSAVVVPVLLWNYAGFGSIVPVSGMVKQQDSAQLTPLLDWWASIAQLAAKAQVPGAALILFGGLLGALLAGLWFILRARVLARDEPLWLLFPAALLHWLYYAFFMREFNVPWHLYLQVAAAYTTVGLALKAIEQRYIGSAAQRAGLLIALLALILVSDIAYARLKSVRRPEVAAALAAGDWLQHTLPAGASYLMYDSWFAALRTPALHPIDMSGLVGDAAFAVLAKQHRYAEMVARFHPAAVVVHLFSPCEKTQADVQWASPLVVSRAPFREAVLSPAAFVAAWQALPATERFESWPDALRDRVLCNANTIPDKKEKPQGG